MGESESLRDEIKILRGELSTQQQITKLYTAVNEQDNKYTFHERKFVVLNDELDNVKSDIKNVKDDIGQIKKDISAASEDRGIIKESVLKTKEKLLDMDVGIKKFIINYNKMLWKNIVLIILPSIVTIIK